MGEIVDRQVQAIVRLLEDVFDVSRVTRGHLSVNMQPIDIVPAIKQAVEWNRAAIDSKGQHLVVQQPQRPILVNGDPIRLAQVVSNLLGNAAKFTDAGGRIQVIAETATQEAIVRVRDTGCGLEPTDVRHIFDPFFQSERTVDRNKRGLGIGLALVRRLVEVHGGRVEVFSEGMGCGSEFVLHLPLLSATASSSRRSPETAAGALPHGAAR
jgi:signal transduction histidine kinase